MGQFNLAAANPLMKIHFAPKIVKQFNSAAILYNLLFEGKGIAISNRGFEIPVHYAPAAGDNWIGDGGNLPSGDSENLVTANVGFFNYSRTIQFTGATLDAVGDDAVSYARALSFGVRNATINAIKRLNIYAFGPGNGVLGQVGSGSNAVTLSTTAVNNGVDLSGSVNGVRYLRVNDTVDFINPTNGAVKATATVTALGTMINFANPSNAVNLSKASVSTAALATGDYVVLTGSYNSVMTGLRGIIDDGTVQSTFQNVAIASFPQYISKVQSLSGSPALSRDHLRQSIATIQQMKGSVNLASLKFISNLSQLHAYASMGWQLKRFNGGLKMDLGYTQYEFEGGGWLVDTDCQNDTIYVADLDSMFRVTARELSFDDRTGSILRQVPNSSGGYADSFVAFLLFRGNLGVYERVANTAIYGLGVVTGY